MNAIEHLLRGRTADLGGFQVKRVLPSSAVRMVGPFIFVDHMGPAQFAAGQGIDVRPHPHIGLATVTYLLEGEFLHRDSLGTVQRITPGDVNWMIAGGGIVHSERTPAERRVAAHRAHGMQTWVALPDGDEDCPAAFEHHPAATLPTLSVGEATVTVIAGEAFGARSPVRVLSPTLYCAATLPQESVLAMPPEHEERGVYVIEGAALVDGQRVEPGELAVLRAGREVQIDAPITTRLMLLGGAPVGQRLISWNFVASSSERIESAQQEWLRYGTAGGSRQFGKVAGDDEFIPLPQR